MPDRPLCLLLPGLDGTGRLFGPLLDQAGLPFEPRAIALPGESPLGYDQLAAWLTDRLPNDRRFALLAESFSGPLAIRIASCRPKFLTHLILAATFLREPLQPWLSAIARLASTALVAWPLPAFAVRRLLAGPDADASMVDQLRYAMAGLPARVAVARVRAALAAEERSAFARVAVPTLWIEASADRLLRPGHGEEARAYRPETEVVSIQAPHLVLQSRPRECLDAMGRFLVRTGSGAGAHSP